MAQHWTKTAPVPPPGSFQEALLAELADREKNLDFARMYIFADLIGEGLGIAHERVTGLLDLYEAELHHDTYDPSFIARKREEIQARVTAERQKAMEAQQRARAAAAAVSAMTITEEDLKPPGR